MKSHVGGFSIRTVSHFKRLLYTLQRAVCSDLHQHQVQQNYCFAFFSVEIFRDPHVPLGISIVGGHTVIKRLKNGEQLKGIFIKQVLEDSPAGRTKALKTGDKILEVSCFVLKRL